MAWTEPSLTLNWGPYQKPDAQEQLAVVQTVQAALGGSGGKPIITRTMALEKLRAAGVIDIENIGPVVEELEAAEQEAKEAEQKALEQAAKQQPPQQRQQRQPEVIRQRNRGR